MSFHEFDPTSSHGNAHEVFDLAMHATWCKAEQLASKHRHRWLRTEHVIMAMLMESNMAQVLNLSEEAVQSMLDEMGAYLSLIGGHRCPEEGEVKRATSELDYVVLEASRFARIRKVSIIDVLIIVLASDIHACWVMEKRGLTVPLVLEVVKNAAG